MTLKEWIGDLQKKGKELEDLTRRRMPAIVGRMAVSHFQDNFRRGGFVDNGLQAWQPAKRKEGKSKKAAGNYGTLLSSRRHLFDSISYIPGDAAVLIKNDVPYASIHNEGGQVNTHPTVTPKMRRFAWAKYYEALGGQKPAKGTSVPEDAARWRALALTKKTNLDVKFFMPKRQFIGESKELTDKINAKWESEIEKIIDNS
jgi:phage gpG-like protein